MQEPTIHPGPEGEGEGRGGEKSDALTDTKSLLINYTIIQRFNRGIQR